MTTKWSDIKRRLDPNGQIERERRAVIEDFLDAHYEVACDAAKELFWWVGHPEAAARLVAYLRGAAGEKP